MCVYTAVLTCPVLSSDGYIQQLLHVCPCRFAAMHQGNPIHTFMFDKEGMLPGKLVHLRSLLSTSSPATAHLNPSKTRLSTQREFTEANLPCTCSGECCLCSTT